jgi:hypothetical protein
MRFRALPGLARLLCLLLLGLCYSSVAFSGYRTFLDPRSMAMGGTGVAASTKFNASSHNPALIAFNRGNKPDKIHISASLGTRELHNFDLESDIRNYQNSDVEQDFLDAVGEASSNSTPDQISLVRTTGAKLKKTLEDMNLSSYREDETSAFSLLVDTNPVTINFFTRREIREMITIIDTDVNIISTTINHFIDPDNVDLPRGNIDERIEPTVDSTYFEIKEFGATVATTNVYDYNMPISWGFTPKLIEMNGSHISTKISDYDVANPVDERISTGLLEWNLDVGFAMLLTDDFLEQELGLDGFWLEGEWVFGMSGMNLFPTDFTPFGAGLGNPELPGEKRAIQAQYQLGIAHYRENFMLTMDIELSEHEVFDFEGITRFVSIGGEYYWRDDLHIRAGVRINTVQTEGAGRDTDTLSAGFLYQPHGLSIEAAVMGNELEVGATFGFGLTF